MLFIFSGIGNGSTYKMIPAIFHAKAQLEVGAGLDLAEADHRAIQRSGALIGLAGAIGALGGVMVNLAFRQSFLTLKNGDGAYIAFIAFYAVCCLVTWVVFMRNAQGDCSACDLACLIASNCLRAVSCVGLIGVVRVEWGGYSYQARSVLGGEDLVCVAFEACRRSAAVEILQHQAAHPDAGHFDVGHDVARAYALDPAAAVEVLALGEEVARLLRVGDGEAPMAVTASDG